MSFFVHVDKQASISSLPQEDVVCDFDVADKYGIQLRGNKPCSIYDAHPELSPEQNPVVANYWALKGGAAIALCYTYFKKKYPNSPNIPAGTKEVNDIDIVGDRHQFKLTEQHLTALVSQNDALKEMHENGDLRDFIQLIDRYDFFSDKFYKNQFKKRRIVSDVLYQEIECWLQIKKTQMGSDSFLLPQTDSLDIRKGWLRNKFRSMENNGDLDKFLDLVTKNNLLVHESYESGQSSNCMFNSGSTRIMKIAKQIFAKETVLMPCDLDNIRDTMQKHLQKYRPDLFTGQGIDFSTTIEVDDFEATGERLCRSLRRYGVEKTRANINPFVLIDNIPTMIPVILLGSQLDATTRPALLQAGEKSKCRLPGLSREEIEVAEELKLFTQKLERRISRIKHALLIDEYVRQHKDDIAERDYKLFKVTEMLRRYGNEIIRAWDAGRKPYIDKDGVIVCDNIAQFDNGFAFEESMFHIP